ncbi:hypothetical protein, partial [Shouchella miscanthi]|nr:hypothetical protein [Shouchella miscanthi]
MLIEHDLIKFQNDDPLITEINSTVYVINLLNADSELIEQDLIESLIVHFKEEEEDFVSYLNVIKELSSNLEFKESLIQSYNQEIQDAADTQIEDDTRFQTFINKLAALEILDKKLRTSEIPDYLFVDDKPGFNINSDSFVDTKLSYEIFKVLNDDDLKEEYYEYIQQYEKSNGYFANFNPEPSLPNVSFVTQYILNENNEELKSYLANNTDSYVYNMSFNKGVYCKIK